MLRFLAPLSYAALVAGGLACAGSSMSSEPFPGIWYAGALTWAGFLGLVLEDAAVNGFPLPWAAAEDEEEERDLA